jgi:hypothetical protein
MTEAKTNMQNAHITPAQIQSSCQAILEVLNGADPSRILALTEQLSVGKVIMGELAAGRVVLARSPSPEPAAPPAVTPNRKARRASAAKSRGAK